VEFDAPQAKRILKFLHQRVAKLADRRSIGEALHGSRLYHASKCGADVLIEHFSP
jgi:hypothetical protein